MKTSNKMDIKKVGADISVGKTGIVNGIPVLVKKSSENGCIGCVFSSYCHVRYEYRPGCFANEREDKQSIIFINPK